MLLESPVLRSEGGCDPCCATSDIRKECGDPVAAQAFSATSSTSQSASLCCGSHLLSGLTLETFLKLSQA